MTKWDRALIVIVIIISLTGMYLTKQEVTNNYTKYLKISVDGKEYKKISLGSNMNGKTIDIKTEFGYNKLKIENNGVRVIEDDSPKKLDIKQGLISDVGESIICMPNRLVVEIISENDEKEVDYISY